MKKTILSLVLLLNCLAVVAQTGLGSFRRLVAGKQSVSVITTTGVLEFRHYPGNIIQTTFESSSYKGEQVSNAVIQPAVAAPRVIQNDSHVLRLQAGSTVISIRKKNVQVVYGNGPVLTGFAQQQEHQVLQFALSAGEPLYGAGSRSIPLNRYGYKVELNNNPWYGYSTDADNLNFSMPFLQSARGYGLFFDNPSRGFFDMGKTNPQLLEAGFKAGKLQFYTFTGANPAAIIKSFTQLVGRMPLPPRWALGNFMSRFGYKTQQEVLEIAGKMKEQQFPFDAVIIDLFWFGDGVHGAWNMGNLDWDRKRFPQPEQMIDTLKKQNIKTILITEPFVLAESFNYAYTQQNKLNAVDKKGDTIGIKEFFFGHAGLIDIFQNKSKDWFWSKYDAQIKKGVAGWWGDLGEPEKHPDYLYHNLKDKGFNRLFRADEVHNMYGHLWSQMLFEKYAKHYPSERLFHLNRSGYAGTWRFGSFPWSGDVDRSWNGFKAQLPIMLGMGLSGVPTMHSDAGGFAMGQRDPELYRRWLQMAVFSPIFRPHGSVNAPDPKIPQIESEPVFYDEPDKSILRSFIELRYRLMPYIYQLAYEAATNGAPFVRPLFFNDTTDKELYKATDQYYFGPSLLVAPVLEKGATKRKLYLPRGLWYDFWKPGQRIDGAKWIEVDVTNETIPVFVKAGSVIPMKPLFSNTGEYPEDQLVFHYYAHAGVNTHSFYEDDGNSPTALTSGAFETIKVYTVQKTNPVSLTFSTAGSYKGKPAQRNVELYIHGIDKPKGVIIDDVKLEKWMMEGRTLHIPRFVWNGKIKNVQVK